MTPGLSVTATNTDNVTLDRIGVEAATLEAKTQLTVRMRCAVQLNNFPDTLNYKPVWLLRSPFFNVHGPLNKSGSGGG